MTTLAESPLKRKKPINWSRTLFIISNITLPWAAWLLFYVYVNLSGFTLAFQDASTGGFTIKHFIRFWNEIKTPTGQLNVALRNTIITFLISTVAMPFRILVPYFIYKKIPLHGLWQFLFYVPNMIFGMAMVMVFTQLIGTQGFIAQQIGEWMGLDYVPELLADSRFANYVVWIHMLWVGFPGNLIIWGGTFARIPTEVLESGQIDGVNWVQEFTLITIPLVWPTFALHLLLAVCGLLGSSGAVFLLTNGEFGTQTLSTWLYMQTLAGVGNPDAPVFNYMSAVGIVMTIVAVSLTFTVKRFTKKAFAGVDY